ncbi:hypothetical protein GCM10028818_20040 [Spirosoma horti]
MDVNKPIRVKNYLTSLLIWLVIAATGVAQPIKSLTDWLAVRPEQRANFTAQSFSHTGLTRSEADQAAMLLLADIRAQQAAQLQKGWAEKSLTDGEHVLRFDYHLFGEKPKDGRSLFISLHGGGNAPAAVNDQQWKNQIGLYKPSEGVYVAPRAPTNTWNLWHEAHIDPLLDQLIQAAVLVEGVNPDKVYIMGYSAGGDGVYQLATRMADRWAAAAMMAGHPNEVTPVNLRNIGFTLHMGALDKAYDRNKIAERWGHWLDSLQTADPGGYKHLVQLHEGRSHWMQREDTVAVPWMRQFRRNPIPDKVVWKQDDRLLPDFYWLAAPESQRKADWEAIVSYKGNTIRIEKNDYDTLCIRLNDKMMNLDKPVEVLYDGKRIFNAKVTRTPATLRQTITGRHDPGLIFSAEITIRAVAGKLTAVAANG